MTYQNQALYEKLEIDIPDTMERFMNNEGMYIKFLKKFIENTQFAELQEQIDAGQWEDALMTSHNLKSFTGNLALFRLHKLLADQVAAFRAENREQAAAMMTDICAEREHIITILQDAGI